MRIEDIDPNWTSEELIEEMMKEANEIDLILYLSGLDDDALKRVEERNECLDILEEIKKY